MTKAHLVAVVAAITLGIGIGIGIGISSAQAEPITGRASIIDGDTLYVRGQRPRPGRGDRAGDL